MNKIEPFDDWVRQQLDQLDETPLEQFKQTDMWNRLRSELHPRPKPKAVITWRKLRIAVIIFLFLGVWGTYHVIQSMKSPNVTQAQKTYIPQLSKTTKKSNQLSEKQIVTKSITTSTLLKKNVRESKFVKTVDPPTPQNSITEPPVTIVEQPEPAPNVVTTEENTEAQTHQTEVVELKIVAKANKLPAKPRLRIVHQNELTQTETVPTPANSSPQSLMVTVNVGKTLSESRATSEYPNPIKLSKKSKTN